MKKHSLSAFILILNLIPALCVFGQSIPGLTSIALPPGYNGTRFMYVQAMITDNQNCLWIGTRGTPVQPGLLAKYGAGEWEIFTTENSPLPADTVYSLFPFNNKLYIGTARGLAIYDGNWQIINTSNGLPDNQVKAIYVNSQAMYTGTSAGLSVYSNEIWVHYNTGNSGICDNNIQSLALDATNTLWIGTTNGLSALSNGTWTTYNFENSALTGNDILTLLVDWNDHVWVGTNQHGLYKIMNDTMYAITDLYLNFSENNSTVYSLTLDNDGKIWTGLKIGDYKLVKLDTEEVQVYSIRVSMPHITFCNGLLWYFRYPLYIFFSYNTSLGLMHDAFNRIETNNISADFTAGGRVAWDDYLETGHFEVPKGSGKHTVFAHSLCLGGLSNDTVVSFYSPVYRQEKEYWPGPVSTDPAVYQQQQENWNKVWKISENEIAYHRLHWNDPVYNMPRSITSWPAHGDTLAGQEWLIAPFKDANQNSLYEPYLGDYPVIRGDEAMYFIFNDHRSPDTASGSKRLGIEVRGMAYAFNMPQDSALYHTIFVNYQIINRSARTYDSLYAGFYTDLDIGWHTDDFIGCDTLLQAYFGYNGTPVDGSGQPTAYGEFPPSQAVVFLNQNLYSFIARSISTASGEIPWHDPDFYSSPLYRYNSLRAIWLDGTPLVTGGMGHPNGGGGNVRTWHLFPGDLNDMGQWHELSNGISIPSDRRVTGSTYIGTFEPGQHICFDMAFVFGRDYTGNHISSVDVLKQRIQQVHTFYAENFSNDCSDLLLTAVPEIPVRKNELLKCYPNPAAQLLTLEYVPQSAQASYRLYNAMGTLLRSEQIVSGITTIPLYGYFPGLYIIAVHDGGKILYQKIIKY